MANEEAIEHYANVHRIAAGLGNETTPNEDVIDLAQAIAFLYEWRFDGPPQHDEVDCWLAGSSCHINCTPPKEA